jgi:hypothetical protein
VAATRLRNARWPEARAGCHCCIPATIRPWAVVLYGRNAEWIVCPTSGERQVLKPIPRYSTQNDSSNPALAAVHGQAALLLRYNVPTYYVSRELLTAAVRTELPDDMVFEAPFRCHLTPWFSCRGLLPGSVGSACEIGS